jgi:capsular exopolysaccharide synthesis family protein
MICSANIGEGKTETAANLAVAAARVGLRTVLVDADLRRPAIAKRFGLGRSTGLSDALLNGEPAERHMVDVGVEDLYVLPAGTIPPNPAELLASPAMRAMQQGLLRKYDLVVIDTPAVLAVPDALEIGPYVDLAVMVGRVGQTGRRRLGAAVERLEQVGSAVSGTVLNGLDRATDGYYYAYAYEEPQEKKSRRQTRRERKAAEAKAKADAKAEAKQAKVDAKQARVDAKAGAKAAKRAGRRQGGRGGDRRGYDEQVEQTLRAAGGAAAVNEVVRRAAAEAGEERASSTATAPAAAEPRSVAPADEPGAVIAATEPASEPEPAIEPTPRAEATREAEPGPAPAPQAAAPPAAQPEPEPMPEPTPAPEPAPAPEPEPAPAPQAEPMPAAEAQPEPEPAPAAPTRRRTRRKTSIPAATPAATRRRSPASDGSPEVPDELDVEVAVPERPVVRVASHVTDDDDNLLFSERPGPDTSA